MSKKIVIPEGMLNAANEAFFDKTMQLNNTAEVVLEAALLWQSENPPFPTEDQREAIAVSLDGKGNNSSAYYAEWVRRMYLAAETEVPKENSLAS